ncbi:MAG: DUF262 domain-containing HNH endonuclease family protein [Bryobacteraceae bacterium]
MATGRLLETNTVHLNDLFANGKLYRVPQFQRDYSWREDQWEELWSDLEDLRGGEHQHYMGAVVLQGGPREFVVIDGQQRLATLSILALAVLKRLTDLRESDDKDATAERYELLHRQFIGYKDPVTLRSRSKLTLNETDDRFFQSNLVNFHPPASQRKLRKSERLMWQAFEYFLERVSKLGDSQALANFLDNVVAQRLLFIQIRVEDDLSAYTLFETLNARGLELTASDLVKNFLLSKVAASGAALDEARQLWQRLSAIVSATDLPVFLRHFLNSRQPYVRQERLFRTIRQQVGTAEKVFEFLTDLGDSAVLYSALADPNDELWHDYPDAKKHVRVLNLFKVSQYKPLALACAAKLLRRDLHRVLHACVVVSFRFNVIGQRSTHELEQAYNKAAIDVWEGTATKPSHVVRRLRDIYIPDDEFQRAFEFATFELPAKRKLASYVLSELEKQAGGTEVDFEQDGLSLEHIYPENPATAWAGFEAAETDRFVNRLGNLTMLETALNKKAGAKDFARKQAIYAGSSYRLTSLIRGEEWSPSRITLRQEELAKLATRIWRI